MGFGPLGGLLGLLLLISLIYMAVKLIQSVFSNSKSLPDKQDSLTILKNRLAKGEITQEEYNRTKELLMG